MDPDPRSPIARHSSTPAELQERLAIERRGVPFLVYRDPDGRQVIRAIAPTERRLAIGRRAGDGVVIDFDEEVSRLHAELELIGEEWTISDDGLSRNGTYVRGERIRGRRRLQDGDTVTVGQTVIAFCHATSDTSRTKSAVGTPAAARITAADRCVLVALCRPLRDTPTALPATNQAIADELHLSLPAVKKRLGGLFEQFEVDGLAQNQKRVALAQAAIRGGIVSPGEL